LAETGVASLILCAGTASELDSVALRIAAINPNIKIYNNIVDITSETAVTAIAETVRKDIGRLDIPINNSGMTNKWDSITKGDTDMYLKTWDLHIKGTYLMLKSFLPLLVETAERHNVKVDVINTTSIAGHFTLPGVSAYQASRFALVRLSEFVVAEYGVRGLTACH
jgi:NAD(P)-dependent dehydrogenase (short-subunit alcohol dehydrogenase family)